MANLSAPQIAGAATLAGWAKGSSDLTIAVAVALAESGGDAAQISGPNTNGSHDYGLWQINDFAHPDLIKPGADWSNPLVNAQMAHTVWAHGGWHAWSTYNSGAYATHLLTAHSAAQNPEVFKMGPDQGGVLGETARGASQAADSVVNNDWVKAIVGAFKLVGQAAIWMANPENWLRVVKANIGIILIAGGAYVAMKPRLEPIVKKSAKLAAVAA